MNTSNKNYKGKNKVGKFEPNSVLFIAKRGKCNELILFLPISEIHWMLFLKKYKSETGF